MAKRHIIELLVEANKQISTIITKMEGGDPSTSAIIDQVNDVIRQLDSVVEQLE